MDPDQILRPVAAAAFLGIGKTTLYRLAARGLIAPPIKLGERASGWRRSDLIAFVNAREAHGVPA
ncbi:AlpA family transcriptional regulator [Paraburkholderia sp. CNPSo 3281]|uniref:helix-turn-helix transcriptional regulator n=1 Tax=Paraburkholderia sp. CNPSo 3281 TaxID=2940933 RepID=UPI0020B7ADC7|nr:helix-turn-helix domain-containing protein [Paraburkholderia sp. CNPSo 3281]MCP3714892.1 helix-turn-helix domain-containing protein [Paraburkholderia sp. CNPSo 3281]